MQNNGSCGGSGTDNTTLRQALDDIDQALCDLENINMEMSTLTVALADRVARVCGPLPWDRRVKLVAGVHSLLAKSIETSTALHGGTGSVQ